MMKKRSKKQNKHFISTFSFFYKNEKGRDDATQFCAADYKEAELLFQNFCIEDEGMSEVPEYDLEVVYEKTDYWLFGEHYRW